MYFLPSFRVPSCILVRPFADLSLVEFVDAVVVVVAHVVDYLQTVQNAFLAVVAIAVAVGVVVVVVVVVAHFGFVGTTKLPIHRILLYTILLPYVPATLETNWTVVSLVK